eukprot:2504965-Prymnesium_polylepis.2
MEASKHTLGAAPVLVERPRCKRSDGIEAAGRKREDPCASRGEWCAVWREAHVVEAAVPSVRRAQPEQAARLAPARTREAVPMVSQVQIRKRRLRPQRTPSEVGVGTQGRQPAWGDH